MVIVINKETSTEQLQNALKELERNKKKIKLLDFFGKLKGHFGDGVDYQRNLRDEWD